MQSFDLWMNNYQTSGARLTLHPKSWGPWRGRGYPWILPADLWEEALWPGIRKGSDNSVSDYVEKNGVQKHSGVHNLKSSWTLCANLYFPFRASAYGWSYSLRSSGVMLPGRLLHWNGSSWNMRRTANCIHRPCLEKRGAKGAPTRPRRISVYWLTGAAGWSCWKTSSWSIAFTGVPHGDTRVVPDCPATPIRTAATTRWKS